MSQKQKFYFTALAVFIILALLIFGVIFPLIGKIKADSRNYMEGKKNLLVLEKEIKEVKRLEKTYQEVKAAYSKLETVFLDPEETLGFITSLEKLANESENSIKIEGVSISREGEFMNFQIFLFGSCPNLIRFLTGIENVPYPPYRLVEIENIDIKKLPEGILQTNLGVKAYLKKL